jgi:hypothetical protein
MNDSPIKNTKVWKKINIWEVSACGIPMYPRAHKSFSSQETEGDQLNMEDKPMEDSENPEEEKSEDSGSESETPEPEAEAPAEEKPAEEAAEGEGEATEKSFSSQDLVDIIAKGFKQAIQESSTQRGFVEKEKDLQKEMKDELKKKSIGELAVMSGLFQKPPIIGSTREFE